MIELFFKLVNHQALDEWNERTVAFFVLLLVLDFFRRIFGRAQFKFELSNVAKKWIEHKKERNGGSEVVANPHPRLNVLLEEVVDELREHRKENDEQFRDLRTEFDDSLREHGLKIREEMDKELGVIRSRLSELE